LGDLKFIVIRTCGNFPGNKPKCLDASPSKSFRYYIIISANHRKMSKSSTLTEGNSTKRFHYA